MLVGILKESAPERRVAVLPEIADQVVKLGLKVAVESDAGKSSFAYNEDYQKTGAEILNRSDVFEKSDFIIKINLPTDEEIKSLKPGKVLLSIIQPLINTGLVKQLN